MSRLEDLENLVKQEEAIEKTETSEELIEKLTESKKSNKVGLTDIGIKRLLIGLSLEVEMQGMIIANRERELKEVSPAYGETQFEFLSNKIRNIALMPDNAIDKIKL